MIPKSFSITRSRSISALLLIAFALIFTSCGSEEGDKEKPETFEIAMFSTAENVDTDPFAGTTWNAVSAFGEEYGITSANYHVDIAPKSTEEEIQQASAQAIKEAKAKGARVAIFAGSAFETSVHAAQQENEDMYFVLIDGVPRDEEHNYELAANSTGVLFAEEEAGFLAGYAAVSDGNRKLGFVGGKDDPPVKRYGYGFLQGAATAAKDGGISDVELKYCYTGTFNAKDWIREGSAQWYEDGTQVIFACGGSIGSSVVEAAENAVQGSGEETAETPGARVIGVDADESQLSETVLTSAKKEIRTAVFDILKTYIHDNFKGNSIFNYSLENNGVSLEMTNARFSSFSNASYGKLVEDIKGGDIKIKKEMGNKELKDLGENGIKVIESPMEDPDK